MVVPCTLFTPLKLAFQASLSMRIPLSLRHTEVEKKIDVTSQFSTVRVLAIEDSLSV